MSLIVFVLLSCTGSGSDENSSNSPKAFESPYAPGETTMSYINDLFAFRINNIDQEFVVDESRITGSGPSTITCRHKNKLVAEIVIGEGGRTEEGENKFLLGEESASWRNIQVVEWDASAVPAREILCNFTRNSGTTFLYTIRVRFSHADWLMQNWEFLE